ncbi:hypothetical protein Sango_0390400 [Sesamum angolense]|uniref:Retrotransposon gag domain-containing protein n=1 Tax=Sesamum angolense TaxID=2727404 RepID=A0AAE2C3V9_9LAMI|nr:hypothetical protein Sango_0390400 [Sesamum angolense]
MRRKGSPFVIEILEDEVPSEFKILDLPKYNGCQEPQEHVLCFEHIVQLYGLRDAMNARIFVAMLQGSAQEWFTSLPGATIVSYDQLIRKFLHQFDNKGGPKDQLLIFSR